ncbi:MAG: hypothetical protein II539_05550, partial [Muribaculaceae bacterium]|nr:hypothetical protein [Muribaculaceae bacterium]
FDVRQGEAHRVVSALRNADFFGKRLYLEIADKHKDYAAMSGGGKHAQNSRSRRKQQYMDLETGFDRKRGGKRTRRDSERGFRSAKARRAAKKDRS